MYGVRLWRDENVNDSFVWLGIEKVLEFKLCD